MESLMSSFLLPILLNLLLTRLQSPINFMSFVGFMAVCWSQISAQLDVPPQVVVVNAPIYLFATESANFDTVRLILVLLGGRHVDLRTACIAYGSRPV